MDACNTFETPQTARLVRLEWGALLVVCAIMFLANMSAVNWPVFAALFIVIDAIGYLPGMIAHRRSATGAVARVYYVLYNMMHCLATWAVLLGGAVILFGWQWAMLAVPLHLLGDRALFGNSLKPFGVSFEPQTHPAFAEFLPRYAAAPAPWRVVDPEPTRAEDDHVAA